MEDAKRGFSQPLPFLPIPIYTTDQGPNVLVSEPLLVWLEDEDSRCSRTISAGTAWLLVTAPRGQILRWSLKLADLPCSIYSGLEGHWNWALRGDKSSVRFRGRREEGKELIIRYIYIYIDHRGDCYHIKSFRSFSLSPPNFRRPTSVIAPFRGR